jgi:hypothetical protein
MRDFSLARHIGKAPTKDTLDAMKIWRAVQSEMVSGICHGSNGRSYAEKGRLANSVPGERKPPEATPLRRHRYGPRFLASGLAVGGDKERGPSLQQIYCFCSPPRFRVCSSSMLGGGVRFCQRCGSDGGATE